ncbi:MAG: cell division protein SepF [Ruminococcaceae bacterium]|nr:cell division protein SepF [Oscillospiraceae bacterium]
MGIFEKIKNIMDIPEEDEFEEEFEEVEEPAPKQRKPVAEPKRESAPRVLGGKSKTVNFNQMQVILVKPERFDDVSAIADHLNDKKTVVLNLESCERDVSRRIIDFLSGVAYANHGNIRKVAVSTFIIVPCDVGVSGELMLEEFDDGRMYF